MLPGRHTTVGREARLLARAADVRRLQRRLAEVEAELELARAGGTSEAAKSDAPANRDTRAWFFEAGAGITPMLAATFEEATYLVSTSDKGVGRSLFVDQRRGESQTLAAALRLLGPGSRRGVFVDVGANIGTTTVPALSLHGFERGLACEPDPSNFLLLKANLLINGLADRVVAKQVAVSSSPGTAPLALSRKNHGDHRLVEGEAKGAVRKRAAVDVDVTRLDDLVRASGIDAEEIGLIWIDTQGHEGDVLEGASGLLGARIPMVIEFSPKMLGGPDRVQHLLAGLRAPGGRVFDLRPDSVSGEMGSEVEDLDALAASYLESGRITDLLVVPERSA